MVLPFHRSDYRKLPDEGKVTDALRAVGVTPGPVYSFPHCTHKDMKSPEVVEKFKRGPVGLLTVFPSGAPAMGKFLALWFVNCLVVGIFVAYLTGRTRAGHAVSGGFPGSGRGGFYGIWSWAASRLDLERTDLGRDREACF